MSESSTDDEAFHSPEHPVDKDFRTRAAITAERRNPIPRRVKAATFLHSTDIANNQQLNICSEMEKDGKSPPKTTKPPPKVPSVTNQNASEVQQRLPPPKQPISEVLASTMSTKGDDDVTLQQQSQIERAIGFQPIVRCFACRS